MSWEARDIDKPIVSVVNVADAPLEFTYGGLKALKESGWSCVVLHYAKPSEGGFLLHVEGDYSVLRELDIDTLYRYPPPEWKLKEELEEKARKKDVDEVFVAIGFRQVALCRIKY